MGWRAGEPRMKIKTTSIDWDTDGEEVDLPQVVELEVEDEDSIADALSDKYGWCISSLNYDILSRKWFALSGCGTMEYIGEYPDFDTADDAAEKLVEGKQGLVWLFDAETAREWVDKLNQHLV
jgi:hypothetical protein